MTGSEFHAGTAFNIIGNDTTKFTGVFDGNDHTISNYTYTSDTEDNNIGLFGVVAGANAELRNLGLIDPNIYAVNSSPLGPLAGQLLDGNITDCYVLGGNVTGDGGSNYDDG